MLEVTDADIEEELKRKFKSKIQELSQLRIEPFKMVDMTVIDFEGFIDGEAFDGGKGNNYSLTIGSHSFIDNFEEQLIGMNIDDEKEIHVTFPEDYHAENLKGKPAMFKVKINEIKEKLLPDLDDDFASDVSDFDTLDEYKEDLKRQLVRKRERSENKEAK